jgi:hypothetical protein
MAVVSEICHADDASTVGLNRAVRIVALLNLGYFRHRSRGNASAAHVLTDYDLVEQTAFDYLRIHAARFLLRLRLV